MAPVMASRLCSGICCRAAARSLAALDSLAGRRLASTSSRLWAKVHSSVRSALSMVRISTAAANGFSASWARSAMTFTSTSPAPGLQITAAVSLAGGLSPSTSTPSTR